MVALDLARLLWLAGASKTEAVACLSDCIWGSVEVKPEEIKAGIDTLYFHWDKELIKSPPFTFAANS